MKRCAVVLVAACLGATVPRSAQAAAPKQTTRPNIVILYADDLGYGDLGCYGAPAIRTPNLDRLAREGTRFTSFYVSQPVCSASRASLMTGCYANRIGIHGALDHRAAHGLGAGEATLAEVVRARGYATAIFGKWHLGHLPEFLPTRHGFDEYFGLPYSNDMWPFHPEAAKGTYPDLPLLEGETVVERNPDQRQLTRRYTEHAEAFIRRERKRPFLLYVPYAMPHVPLHASARFAGRSRAGLYGDVVEEIDWSVGRILKALRACGIDRRTLVIFMSDNGPWLSYGNHAGSSGPLREGKGTVWEGGVRVPCLVRWPGAVPAGRVCAEPLMTIDWLPTIARLAGAGLSSQAIDGLDAWPVIAGQAGARSPHEALLFYFNVNELQALRSGPWKLHLPHRYRTLGGREGGRDGVPAVYQMREVGLELYDLESDPGERLEVSAAHPQVVQRLLALAEVARKDLGDSLTGRTGQGNRAPGRVSAP